MAVSEESEDTGFTGGGRQLLLFLVGPALLLGRGATFYLL